MSLTSPRDDEIVAAVAAAICPYPWRSFTPDLLARLVLAARDREALTGVLAAVDGSSVGEWPPLEPTPPADGRVAALVAFLGTRRWTELRLPVLCRHLLSVTDGTC